MNSSQTPANSVRLRLLGGFRLEIGNGSPEPVRLSARKSSALLAYLAVQPERSAGRSTLATLLWGDRPDRQARQNLRQCLASLRAELAPLAPDLIHLDGENVEMRLPPEAVDAMELLARSESAKLPDLLIASDLYCGEFLAGFDIDSEPFREWMEEQRHRFEQAAIRAYESCAQRLEQQGDVKQALAKAERLVAFDPFREDWQRQVIRLTAFCFGRDAGLAKAGGVVKKIESELGVSASPSTLALIEDIRRSEDISTGYHVQSNAVPGVAVPPASIRETKIRPSRRAFVAVLCAIGVLAVATSGWFVAGTATPLSGEAKRAEGTPPAMSSSIRFGSLAILPFKADTQDGAAPATARRIRSELIKQLSSGWEVQLLSEQVSASLGDQNLDVVSVGRALGVRHLLIGQVTQTNSRLHVHVELVDAVTRLHLWSDDRETEGKDGADFIARGLARSLVVEFVDRQARWAAGQSDPGISGLLARGWAIIQRHNTANTTNDARVFFEEVLRRDPDNVPALTGMGAVDAAAVANLYVKDREPYLTRAESFLNRAITLNPKSAGSFYWLGVTQETRGQVDDALNSFTHAANLRPSFALAYAQAGHLEAEMGRPGEGLAKIRYAISLNPRDPANGRWCLFAGQIELEQDNLDAAAEWMSCALQNMPRNTRVHATLAAIYALSGRMSEAAEQVATVRKLSGDLEMITSQSVAPLNSGSKIGGARLIEGWRKAMSAS